MLRGFNFTLSPFSASMAIRSLKISLILANQNEGMKSKMDISSALEKIISRENLSIEQTRDLFLRIMSGHATEAQIAAILIALRVKGECPEELAGAALVMRELSTKVEIDLPNLIDTCGTGGSGSKLFNISTASTFVCAGAGAHIAKHGNRKMTSSCGSADVLEAAGVNLNLNAEQIASCIKTEISSSFFILSQFDINIVPLLFSAHGRT